MMVGRPPKMNPRRLRKPLSPAFDGGSLCEAPTIAGRASSIPPDSRSTGCLGLIPATDDKLGVPAVTEPKRIVVDFSAPNVAKPMHVGHISQHLHRRRPRPHRAVRRPRCHHRQPRRRLGHAVRHDLHGWKTKLDHDALERDAIHELVRVYRAVNADTKADAAVLEHCKQELVKTAGGRRRNLKIWQECVKLTLDQLHGVYARLSVKFDHYLGESFYNDALAPLVEDLLAKKLAVISDGGSVRGSPTARRNRNRIRSSSTADGAWVPAPCLVRKSDGGFLYSTTDLATIIIGFMNSRRWKSGNVVGAPQQLHFRQVFETSHRRGHATRMEHIAFGSILDQTARCSKHAAARASGCWK